MKFKGKCRALHLGRHNPKYLCTLGVDLLESSSAEKDLGVLGCMHQEKCGQQVKGGYPPPLLCPGEAMSGEPFAQIWAPHFKKQRELLERIHWRTTKMIRDLEHLSYEDRLRKLNLFSLEKR